MYQFVFHFKSRNILSHLAVKMIMKKKCNVSESLKWNISMMSKENLSICLNISFIKKIWISSFFFFHLLLEKKYPNHVCKSSHFEVGWNSVLTNSWKQTYKYSSDIPSCCGNYWQYSFKESVSQKHVYNPIHRGTFLAKLPLCCFTHNVWASSGARESH